MARVGKPWYRESKNTWYCTMEGRKVSLKVKGRENEKEATQAWHRLFAGMPLETTEKPQEPPIVPQVVPMVKQEPKPASVSVSQVINAFLADSEYRVKPTTSHVYRLFLTPFAERFGDMPASQLTTTTAESYARKPTWSNTTQHDFLTVLSSAFTFAERTRMLDRSPLAGLKKPPVASRGADTVVSAETVKQFLAHADPEFGALVRFLWLTGCRPSEASGLQVEDIRWEERFVILEEHKTAHKGKARVIYLSDEAMAILREQRAEHPRGYLFRRPTGGRWTTDSITNKFFRVSEEAGVKVTSYGLRHTFATDALSKGLSETLVAGLLGHSGTQTLHKHYSHLTARSQALRDALSQVR